MEYRVECDALGAETFVADVVMQRSEGIHQVVVGARQGHTEQG